MECINAWQIEHTFNFNKGFDSVHRLIFLFRIYDFQLPSKYIFQHLQRLHKDLIPKQTVAN